MLTSAVAVAVGDRKGKYPVDVCDDDRRFSKRLLAGIAAVLAMEGFPAVREAEDLAALGDAIFGFLYLARGVEGEIEARLNGLQRPLRTYTSPGALNSADCCATAHELRRMKGARLAVVVAMDGDNVLHIGTAADHGSAMDDVAARLLDAIERVALPEANVEPCDDLARGSGIFKEGGGAS